MVNKVIKCLEDCRQTKFVSINEYTPPIYRTKLNKCIQSILYNPKKNTSQTAISYGPVFSTNLQKKVKKRNSLKSVGGYSLQARRDFFG